MSDRYDMPMVSEGNHGSVGAMSADDALIAKLTMLHQRLHQGGFSDQEVGAFVSAYMTNWGNIVTEGNHGSVGA